MSFQIPHINGIMFRVFLCLTSLSMIISRSTHVAAKSMISFFSWLSSISLCVCARICAHTCICTHTYTCVCTHVYIRAHTRVYVHTPTSSLSTPLSVDTSVAARPGCCKQCCCGQGAHESFWTTSTVRPEGTSTVSFGGTSRMSSIVAASVYIPTNSVGGTITHFLKQWLCLQRFFTYW